MRRADCGSDHFLVRITCSGRFEEERRKQLGKRSTRKYDISQLKNERSRRKYEERINAELQKRRQTTWIESKWEEKKTTIERENKEVIGYENKMREIKCGLTRNVRN